MHILPAADEISMQVNKSQNDYELMNVNEDVRLLLIEVRKFLLVLDQDDTYNVRAAITYSSKKILCSLVLRL